METKKHREIFQAEKITAIFSDLDNTLWKGILAEKQKLTLNKDYYEFLKKLYKKGIQIIIVSKNDEPDVENAFKELGIDRRIFTIVISNWDPKYLNIERLLQYTKLRPETVVFIDDNPLERTEVKIKIPQLHCLDISDWGILQGIHYLKEKNNQSESEVKERINRYRTAIRANQLKEEFKEDSEFLKSLKRELSIGEISCENLDRFTRLLVVTHRINFSPGKFKDYNKALDYLYDRINRGDKLFAISTKENDVSLGLTGAIVVNIQKNKAIVVDGTFSCGIIGRDFEQKSILTLIDILRKNNITELEFPLSLTSTNKRVREIFEELGFKIKTKKEEEVTYSVDINNYKPKKTYDWIKVLSTSPEMDNFGIPSIISFFEEKVKPVIKNKFKIINLGSGRGAVLGHLQKNAREEFYKFLNNFEIDYKKLDIDYYITCYKNIANIEFCKSFLIFREHSK